MSEGRMAWVVTYIGQFVILTEEESETQAGKPIRVHHPTKGGRGWTWDLTSLTEEELIALQELWTSAFEWALPVCQQRDKDAQNAFDNGDDSHIRIYRAVPQLVYRKRPVGEHSQSVLDGPSDAPVVGAVGEPGDGDVRADGIEVAERDEEGSKPQDNWPTINQPPSVL